MKYSLNQLVELKLHCGAEEKQEAIFDVIIDSIKRIEVLAYTSDGFKKLRPVVIADAIGNEYWFYGNSTIERLVRKESKTFADYDETGKERRRYTFKHDAFTVKRGDKIAVKTCYKINKSGRMVPEAPSRLVDVQHGMYHVGLAVIIGNEGDDVILADEGEEITIDLE